MNEEDQIVVAQIPRDVSIFDDILNSTDTTLAPIDTDTLDDVRGLALKASDRRRERILVQLFAQGPAPS